jgi:hypothetical protein
MENFRARGFLAQVFCSHNLSYFANNTQGVGTLCMGYFCTRALCISILCVLFTNFLYANTNTSTYPASLLSKRYNEIAFPAAHNAQSNIASPVANQDIPLPEQFALGIRAMKLHVWPGKDPLTGKEVASVCHGTSKTIFEKDYLEMVLEKIPGIVRSFARDLVAKIEPLNELVRDAFRSAYGTKDDERGAIPFNHCIFDPGQRQLLACLQDIAIFLKDNPQAVISVILEDHTDDLEALMQAVTDAGLKQYAHHQKKDAPWPTLGEMIASDHRLVLFIHGKETLPYKKYPQCNFIWDFCWDTEWDFASADDLKNCCKDMVPKRGEEAYARRNKGAKNTVFVVYHFVTDGPGGSKSAAKKVNKQAFLATRLNRLWSQTGHIPNLVQVDFCEHPNNDLLTVVAQLNEKQTR